jgi:hypothetical protein
MNPKASAIIREMRRHLAEMRQRGQLERQLARLRLTTAETPIRKGRRA